MTPTLDTPFDELPADWWLDLTCSCDSKEVRSLLVSRFATILRPKETLGQVIGRLRCLRCHGRPVRAWLGDQPADPGAGPPAPMPTVRIQVLG